MSGDEVKNSAPISEFRIFIQEEIFFEYANIDLTKLYKGNTLNNSGEPTSWLL